MRPDGVLQQLHGLTMAASSARRHGSHLALNIEKTHCGCILQFVNIMAFASIANTGTVVER